MIGSIIFNRKDAIAFLTINNPTRRNAISTQMWRQIADAMDAIAEDASVRCVVFQGAGTQAFGSGADISEFAAQRGNREAAKVYSEVPLHVMSTVKNCRIPTVAAIQGACVGGGLELALCCDIRIATDNSTFGIPIARLGATLGFIPLEILINTVGPSVAQEILLEARIFDASEALRKGLISRCVPPADFNDHVHQTIERIITNAPLSAQWHKRFVARLRQGGPLSEEEVAEGYACFDTQDYIEGYRSFLKRRRPVFIGK